MYIIINLQTTLAQVIIINLKMIRSPLNKSTNLRKEVVIFLFFFTNRYLAHTDTGYNTIDLVTNLSKYSATWNTHFIITIQHIPTNANECLITFSKSRTDCHWVVSNTDRITGFSLAFSQLSYQDDSSNDICIRVSFIQLF